MRWVKPLALLLASVCLLTSCSLLPGPSGKEAGGIVMQSTEKIADARFESVLEAIEDEDAEAIRAMFSKRALAEANDIDTAIEYLFHLLDGKVVSWVRDNESCNETTNRGKSRRFIRSWYIVYTVEAEYLFLLLDYDRNTIDPDLEGLYTLHGINAEYAATQWGSWQDMEAPGVYMPED